MKKIKSILLAAVLALGVGSVVLPASPVSAINVFEQCGANSDTAVCKAKDDNAASMVQDVINILLYVLGIIAVIMIIIGGIRFSTSDGDPAGVKSARNTIIYAIVGLVVAIMAYAIVNLVLGYFKK